MPEAYRRGEDLSFEFIWILDILDFELLNFWTFDYLKISIFFFEYTRNSMTSLETLVSTLDNPEAASDLTRSMEKKSGKSKN